MRGILTEYLIISLIVTLIFIYSIVFIYIDKIKYPDMFDNTIYMDDNGYYYYYKTILVNY
jgi:hypothetical protein